MPRKLTLEERKFILKQYWKTENAQDVIRVFEKDSVYSRKPRSVEDLRQFVIDAFANLDHDLCTKVCHSVVSRCRECIEAEGLQFEYLS